VTVRTKVTKRPHLKIIDKIRNKIAAKLALKIGNAMGFDDILEALKDKAINDDI
jgi:hypothetical protein